MPLEITPQRQWRIEHISHTPISPSILLSIPAAARASAILAL